MLSSRGRVEPKGRLPGPDQTPQSGTGGQELPQGRERRGFSSPVLEIVKNDKGGGGGHNYTQKEILRGVLSNHKACMGEGELGRGVRRLGDQEDLPPRLFGGWMTLHAPGTQPWGLESTLKSLCPVIWSWGKGN